MSMFSFDLDESFEFITKITPLVPQTAGFSLWKKAVLANKGYLIKAIDPKTGRKDYDAPDETVSPDIALSKINNICGCLTNPQTGYGEPVSTYLSTEDISAQSIQANSPAILATKSVKKGMKLSRAISAILRDVYKLAETHISYRVSAITDSVFTPPYEKFTLSANPLEILMCSEHASFTSCHRFGGEYRGGPIHYAQDHFTIVAYAWKDLRDYRTAKLPYKIWRQLIFVDVPNRSLAFMRPYGSLSLSNPAHRALRKQAGRLLHKLCYPDDPNPPKWSYTTRNLVDPITNKDAFTGFAGDAPRGFLKLSARTGGHPAGRTPHLTFPHCVCILCGRRKTARETYDCENCSEDENEECAWCCDGRFPADDGYEIQGGDSICYDCYERFSVRCHSCEELIHTDDATLVEDEYYCDGCDQSFSCAWCNERRLDRASTETINGETICERCASENATLCDGCEHFVHVDDYYLSESGNNSYCEKCVIRCPHCKDAVVDDDGKLCNSCQEEQQQEEPAEQETSS